MVIENMLNVERRGTRRGQEVLGVHDVVVQDGGAGATRHLGDVDVNGGT